MNCAICLDSLIEDKNSIKLICNHIYHETCLLHYIKYNLNDNENEISSHIKLYKILKCPYCRRNINILQINNNDKIMNMLNLDICNFKNFLLYTAYTNYKINPNLAKYMMTKIDYNSINNNQLMMLVDEKYKLTTYYLELFLENYNKKIDIDIIILLILTYSFTDKIYTLLLKDHNINDIITKVLYNTFYSKILCCSNIISFCNYIIINTNNKNIIIESEKTLKLYFEYIYEYMEFNTNNINKYYIENIIDMIKNNINIKSLNIDLKKYILFVISHFPENNNILNYLLPNIIYKELEVDMYMINDLINNKKINLLDRALIEYLKYNILAKNHINFIITLFNPIIITNKTRLHLFLKIFDHSIFKDKSKLEEIFLYILKMIHSNINKESISIIVNYIVNKLYDNNINIKNNIQWTNMYIYNLKSSSINNIENIHFFFNELYKIIIKVYGMQYFCNVVLKSKTIMYHITNNYPDIIIKFLQNMSINNLKGNVEYISKFDINYIDLYYTESLLHTMLSSNYVNDYILKIKTNKTILNKLALCINCKNYEGLTPLQYCIKYNTTENAMSLFNAYKDLIEYSSLIYDINIKDFFLSKILEE